MFKTSEQKKISSQNGLSLVELVITSAVVTLIFVSVVTATQAIVNIISESKARAGAISLAVNRMETLRSFPYNELGTIGGVPSGPIPQNSTTTLNGVVYSERVLVTYFDDPADGLGVDDVNNITTDYKKIKVEYTWHTRNGSKSYYLTSNVVPRGIESTEGGGTLRVNVFNAEIQPLSGVEVRFVNNTTDPPIDTVRITGEQGIALLSGAPEAGNYGIDVSMVGYTTDGTIFPSVDNPNPNTPPVTVLESLTSTMNFQIDLLSGLNLIIEDESTTNTVIENFANLDRVATSTDLEYTTDSFILSGGVGNFASSGQMLTEPIETVGAISRSLLVVNASTTPQTTIRTRIYHYDSGTYTLIPDSVIAMNGEGITDIAVDISNLNPTDYELIAFMFVLETTDDGQTPELEGWQLSYDTDNQPQTGLDISIVGSKTVGVSDGGEPIRLFNEEHTTDVDGRIELEDMVWDVYSLSIVNAGYRFLEICPNNPVQVLPGQHIDVRAVVAEKTMPGIRFYVTDGLGNPVAYARIDLTGPGVSETVYTSACGQGFIGDIPSADYDIVVNRVGFEEMVVSDVSVGLDSELSIVLTSS